MWDRWPSPRGGRGEGDRTGLEDPVLGTEIDRNLPSSAVKQAELARTGHPGSATVGEDLGVGVPGLETVPTLWDV